MPNEEGIPRLLIAAYQYSLLMSGTADRLGSLFDVRCAATFDTAISYLHYEKFNMVLIGWDEPLCSKIIASVPQGTSIFCPKDPGNWYNQDKIFHEVVNRLLYGPEGRTQDRTQTGT